MTAKRDAHLAEIAAQDRAEGAHASGARTRPISVHLTGFAPGCADLALADKRRWRTFYGRTPDQVVRSTLARLKLAPGAVRTATEADGDVSLLGDVPPELLRLISGVAGEPVPFAVFWDGLGEPELQAVLATLVAGGWKPGEATP